MQRQVPAFSKGRRVAPGLRYYTHEPICLNCADLQIRVDSPGMGRLLMDGSGRMR